MSPKQKSGKVVDKKVLHENEGVYEEIVYETVSVTRTVVKHSTCVNCSRCLDDLSDFLPGTHIVSQQYDDILREWVGNYKWRLIYRASEHGYTAKSFHECCDDKEQTLIVIKSSEGWIFGGYAAQSWEVVHPDEWECIYYDMI